MCHLKALEKKGLITREPNMSRAIQLVAEPIDNAACRWPGRDRRRRAARSDRAERAGRFRGHVQQKNLFVLEVSGDSMIDAQIADGDYVVIRKQRTAHSGEIVVAQTDDGEATLKRWFPEANRIRLEPANSTMKPIYVKDARVLGVVVGVVRKLD